MNANEEITVENTAQRLFQAVSRRGSPQSQDHAMSKLETANKTAYWWLDAQHALRGLMNSRSLRLVDDDELTPVYDHIDELSSHASRMHFNYIHEVEEMGGQPGRGVHDEVEEMSGDTQSGDSVGPQDRVNRLIATYKRERKLRKARESAADEFFRLVRSKLKVADNQSVSILKAINDHLTAPENLQKIFDHLREASEVEKTKANLIPPTVCPLPKDSGDEDEDFILEVPVPSEDDGVFETSSDMGQGPSH